MTTFALMVLGAPTSSQSPNTALAFTRAAVAAGHRIIRIFFFHDGVHCGSDLAIPVAGQQSIAAHWAELSQQHDIDLVICVASALKRGILNDSETKRYAKNASNLHPQFDLSGLGQWIEACSLADRVVTFGA